MNTILIVDDNEINLKLFEAILKKAGYGYILARNGNEAIDLSIKCMPDLILMDIQMPELNGEEAFNAIRKNKKTSHIPIIAITSYAMKNDKERMLSNGFDGYLTKPIRVKEFLDEIKKFLK